LLPESGYKASKSVTIAYPVDISSFLRGDTYKHPDVPCNVHS